jgi:hypothetical protein
MSSLGRGMACVALAALAGAGCAGPSEGPGGGDIYRPPEARDDGARDDTARPHDAAEDEPGTGHHCAEA